MKDIFTYILCVHKLTQGAHLVHAKKLLLTLCHLVAKHNNSSLQSVTLGQTSPLGVYSGTWCYSHLCTKWMQITLVQT